MMNFFKTTTIALLLFTLVGVDMVFAGFGVTPPYVRNTSLTRNSSYEQQILLVRGDPKTDLKATVQLDAPGIEDWITVIEGESFALPRGEQKIPMTVRVDVPDDAEFKNYQGAILVKTGAPDDQVTGGAVNISLGAQIDIDLTVIDREIKDFRIRKINISDLNEGHKVGWLFFPGKIRFGMTLENTGNVPVAPSDVKFNIYDSSGTVLLEETSKKGRVDTIEPYATEQVYANIPTHLPAGSYLARYQIFNEGKVKQEGEVSLSVLPFGSVQSAGFGFIGLSLSHKISIILPIAATLFLIVFITSLMYRRKRLS